jgi:hypothetical protein
LPCGLQHTLIDVDADDAAELRLHGQALQQLAGTATQIQDAAGAAVKQVTYHRIEALQVEFAGHLREGSWMANALTGRAPRSP